MELSKLKRWFNHQQIQRKLILSNVLVIHIVIIPMMLVLFIYESYTIRNQTLQNIRVQATIVSDNAATAMAFNDEIAASEALATLNASPDMLRASIVLVNGDKLASYQRKKLPPLLASNTEIDSLEQETLTWHKFTLRKPVFLKSEHLGTLVIEASLNSVYHRIVLFFSVISLTAFIAIGIALLISIKLKNAIIKPLSQLIGSVKNVTDKQDYSVRPAVDSQDEIGDLSRAFHSMLSNLQQRDERLQELAFYDNVTGLPNRHFFHERIEQAVANALRYSTRCGLMFIDLDDFKTVNDTLGHHIGDDLLREVSKRLLQTLRNNDLVCRIGGDEFAVILENITDTNVPATLAQKIINNISQPAVLDGNQIKVGASIGISLCPDNVMTTTELLKTADAAMYVAKGTTKNTFYQVKEDAT
jgi:diguanylate cyclase (GGDEF)-like protein